MKRSVRQVLAETHIAAVAIALLLLWSFLTIFQQLFVRILGGIDYLTTIFVEHRFPSFDGSFGDRTEPAVRIMLFSLALVDIGAACLLSRWVYSAGPVKSLIKSAAALSTERHV